MSTYHQMTEMSEYLMLEEKAALVDHLLQGIRYEVFGANVLAHQIGHDGEAWEVLDEARKLSREDKTASSVWKVRAA